MTDVVAGLEHDLRRRLAEIERELARLEALADEQARIEAALERVAGRSAKPKRGRGRQVSGEPRAPRGANREQILKVVGDRPGVSAAEVAGATGIGSSVVASTQAKLAHQGNVKRSREDGRVRWRLA